MLGELDELLQNVPDSYDDFIIGVRNAVKSREDGEDLMINYIRTNPNAKTDDIIEMLEVYGM